MPRLWLLVYLLVSKAEALSSNNVLMASMEFSLEAAAKSLTEEGFVDLHDLLVGKHVSEMEQKGFAFLSPYGLEYCDQHVLSNPVD